MSRVRDCSAMAAVWALILSPLAMSAIVLRAAVYLPLSFRTASHVFLAACAMVVVVLAVGMRTHLAHFFRMAREADRLALCVGMAACMIAGVAATCLHRPDADDAIYVPKIVHYLAYPQSRMDGSIHEIASTAELTLPRAASTYYPTGYEFAQGAVAFSLGVDFLGIYYALAPWLAAVIGMAALLACIRTLGASPRAAALAVLLLVPMILLLGESHRSYGNLSLARAFQSKFAFFLFGLPLFTSLSLDFFRSRHASIWLSLLVVTVALSGMTTSALVMLPMLALVLFATWLATSQFVRGWMGLGVAYALALLPTFLFALDYRRYATAYAGFGSPLNAWFPQSFSGQFALLEGGAAIPISLLLFGAALAVCLVRAKRNVFVLSWTLLAVLLYLNPVTAPWIMRHITSENIYWRLFYMLPFPLIVGVACAQVIDDLSKRPMATWKVIMAFLLCCICVLISPTSVLRRENHARVGPPGPTLDDLAPDARAIASMAPEGVVLAPIALAQDMAILSARHTQIATRVDFMANVLRDQPGESDVRWRAAQFVAGNGGQLEDMVQVVQRDKPSTVVLARSLLSPALTEALRGLGLSKAGDVGQWVVYVSQ